VGLSLHAAARRPHRRRLRIGNGRARRWKIPRQTSGGAEILGMLLHDEDVPRFGEHRAEPITAVEIARRLGISSGRALAALHREGVEPP